MQPRSRLIDQQAVLVSDDRVALKKGGGSLLASPPDHIAGLLEVRGLGLYRLPYDSDIPVGLAVQLTAADQIERLPDPAETYDVLGVALPTLRMSAFECSSAYKLLLAVSTIERLPI